MNRFSIIEFTQDKLQVSKMIINNKVYILDKRDESDYYIYVEPQDIYNVKQHLFHLEEMGNSCISRNEVLCEVISNDLHIKWIWYFEDQQNYVFGVNDKYFKESVPQFVSKIRRKYKNVYLSLYPMMPYNYDFIPSDQQICTICLKYPYIPLITKCDHLFCSQCINKWITIKYECPTCRTKF